jgi:hypothetical protein
MTMSLRTAWTVAAVSLVIASTAFVSVAGGAQDARTLVRSHPPISASAPCGGHAKVGVRLAHVNGPKKPDLLRVTVSRARPNSRWDLRVAQYQFDQGSVNQYPVQHTDAHGQWVVRDDASKGYLRIDVLATSRGGQVCQLGISGRVSPLP